MTHRGGRPSTVTSEQGKELWRQYKAGESMLAIAEALGQRSTNLYRVLQATGGICSLSSHPCSASAQFPRT